MSTNLSQIRTKVRRYLKESTADRWSNSDLDAYINEGVLYIQSEIHQSNGDYFLRVDTATASAGSVALSLPSDIWGNKLRSLWVYESSTVATGEGYRIEPGQLEWIIGNCDTSGRPLNYSMLGGYLRFAPMLQYNSCFRFVYSKKEQTLVGDTDTFWRINDEYVEAVALYATVLALEQYGLPPGNYATLLDRKMTQVNADVQFTDPIVFPQVAID